MKQAALIVKEDGLIYVNEVPEEPYASGFINQNDYKKAFKQYKERLASAKESAILCADQEQAAGMIVLSHANSMKYRGSYAVGVKPGIYPIPDLEWELGQEATYENEGPNGFKVVAILTPSEPSKGEQESQEELWSAVTDIVDDKIGKYYPDLPTGQLTFNIVEPIKERFTITRK